MAEYAAACQERIRKCNAVEPLQAQRLRYGTEHQSEAAINEGPRALQLKAYAAMLNGSPRVRALKTLEAGTGSGGPVLQAMWVWDDGSQLWEEDVEGYVYDPEWGEWFWGDEDDEDYDPSRHREFELSLLEAMPEDEVLDYFEDHPDADLARDYIDAMPDSDDMVDLGNDEEVFDTEDPLASIAEMTQNDVLDVAFAESDHRGEFVASGGAATCVIVFLRIVTTAGRILLGSIHLTADEMETVDAAVEGLQFLYDAVAEEVDGGSGDAVQTATAYAVGGMASDDIDDLMDMVRLRLAFKSLAGTMTLAGAVMPASDEGQYVDAMMDDQGVSYSVQTQRKVSTEASPVQRVVVDGDMRLDTEAAWSELLPLIEDRRIPSEYHESMKVDLAEIPADQPYDTFDDIVDDLERQLCEREGCEYPWADVDEAEELSDGSGSSGGMFWTFMKYLTYTLMFTHMARSITGANAQPIGGIDVIDEPDDDFDAVPKLPGELTCEPGMEYFCGPDAMANRVYSDVVGTVRNESGPGVSLEQELGIGACRFEPSRPFLAGKVSCDPARSNPQDLPKVAHELEHGLDYFSGTLHSERPAPDWVTSELNAITRQAAVARIEVNLGRAVDVRDHRLIDDFDAGCPFGGELSEMLRAYTRAYLGVWVPEADIEAQWRGEIDVAVDRYNEWIADPA